MIRIQNGTLTMTGSGHDLLEETYTLVSEMSKIFRNQGGMKNADLIRMMVEAVMDEETESTMLDLSEMPEIIQQRFLQDGDEEEPECMEDAEDEEDESEDAVS